MKKIALLAFLLSSLYADAKFYTGVAYGLLNEKFSNETAKANEVSVAKIKVGYGDIAAYAVEFSLDFSETDSDFLSAETAKRYDFNIDLIKAFDYDIYVNPFFKVGVGTGFLDTTDNGKLSFGSFKVGAGTFVPITDSVDIEVGYEYKYLSYEKATNLHISEQSHVNILYLGANFRF